MIYLYFFLNLLLIIAMVWFCIIILRLFLSKEYRKNPPFVPSFGNEKKALVQRVENILAESATNLTVLDPGCGTGTLLLGLAKKFPNHNFIGIEWNKIVATICSLRTWRKNNFKVICDDMFKHDFGQADIIVCFLLPDMLDKFSKKLLQDNRKKQIIFSNTFKIPNLELVEEIKTGRGLLFKNIYVYKI